MNLRSMFVLAASSLWAPPVPQRASTFPPRLVPSNTGLCAGSPLMVHDGRALVSVSEFTQSEDLNGDGDETDHVLHVLDLRDGTSRNLGVARNRTDPGFPSSNPYPFNLCESYGGRDLNGDGDLLDCMLHLLDVTDGRLYNLGYSALLVQLAGDHVDFTAPETYNGDLNGDGDFSDWTLMSRDLRSNGNRRLAASYIWASLPEAVVITVYENLAGQDLTVELGLHGVVSAYFDGTFFVSVYESFHGDLNGDQDTNDSVAFLVFERPATGSNSIGVRR